jgi:hypothetical protein
MRIWEFYLAYCEAAFASGNTDVMQFTLRRPALKRRRPCRCDHHAGSCLCALVPAAGAQTAPPPRRSGADLPGAPELLGPGRLRFMGCASTTRAVGTAPLTVADDWAAPPLALELTLRARLKGALDRRALARGDASARARSTPTAAQRWLAAMTPPVSRRQAEGDRLTGLIGRAMAPASTTAAARRMADAEFARRFFGIWLSPQHVRARHCAAPCWRRALTPSEHHHDRHAAPAALAGVPPGLSYGALGLPLAFVALPLYVLLPNHYASEFGMPLAALGALLLGTRLLDAVADPLDRPPGRPGCPLGALGPGRSHDRRRCCWRWASTRCSFRRCRA